MTPTRVAAFACTLAIVLSACATRKIKDRSRPGTKPSNCRRGHAPRKTCAESVIEMRVSVQPLATTPS